MCKTETAACHKVCCSRTVQSKECSSPFQYCVCTTRCGRRGACEECWRQPAFQRLPAHIWMSAGCTWASAEKGCYTQWRVAYRRPRRRNPHQQLHKLCRHYCRTETRSAAWRRWRPALPEEQRSRTSSVLEDESGAEKYNNGNSLEQKVFDCCFCF